MTASHTVGQRLTKDSTSRSPGTIKMANVVLCGRNFCESASGKRRAAAKSKCLRGTGRRDDAASSQASRTHGRDATRALQPEFCTCLHASTARRMAIQTHYSSRNEETPTRGLNHQPHESST